MATAHSPTSSSFYNRPHSPYSRTNPIDLTLDDDLIDHGRQIKRLRTEPTLPDLSHSNSPTPSLATPSPSLPNAQIPLAKQQAQAPQQPRASNGFALPSIQTQANYRPHFAGPSTSSAFFPNRNDSQHALARSPSANGPVITSAQQQQLQQLQLHHQQHQQRQAMQQPPQQRRQVIDLTSSPSPPPGNQQGIRLPQLQPQSHQQPQPMPQQQMLDVPPKTPVCIGQLSVTALVLYPVSYLQSPTGELSHSQDMDWASVRLQYDVNAKMRNPASEETIHIRTPQTKSAAGDVLQGENFGVVEQKVATVIGPMLGKGLIRLDAKVRRGVPNLPILPLQILVHTPNGNIPIVARYLLQSGLLLDHPSPAWDPTRLSHYLYLNPHNPPPGGHGRNLIGTVRGNGYAGPGGNRWSTPTVTGKSVEVQRSQVDEVFKSLRSGDDLEETEPSPEIATTLYPHQKKALTFLLEREKESTAPGGKTSSLWQMRISAHTQTKSWVNLVTQKEVFKEPKECKGALLADDMGLGKTITCVSLIAATLRSARDFASQPLPTPPKPPLEHSASAPSLSAAHFAGSVWGMPDVGPVAEASTSAKKKAKAAKDHERWEAEYARARRIKVRSRATLIICPLSTVVNWEDQFKEHWAGEVQVVGGSGTNCASSQGPAQATLLSHGFTASGSDIPFDSDEKPDIVNNQPSCSSSGFPPGAGVPRRRERAPERERERERVRDRDRGGPLRVYIYHGNARRPEPTFLADFDAVITTYATLASEYSKQTRSIVAAMGADDDEGEGEESGEGGMDDGGGMMETDEHGNMVINLPKPKEKKGTKRKKVALFSGAVEASSPLQSIHWFRVVLDEAHSIKETSTVGSRASCDLEADRRLCLTGTPVQNKLDDVYALIKFLRLDPFDDRNVWQENVGVPVKFGQPLGVARLQTIMKCITLRRTKETRGQDGQTILALPPRRDELRYLKFDEQEQGIYDEFFKESRAEFKELSHKNEVMKNYVGILQKILRLRQICDHFELVDGKGVRDETFNYDEVIDAITREGINGARASAIFSLIRESGTAQCVECGYELGTPADAAQAEGVGMDSEQANPPKRVRKTKALPPSRGPTRPSSPAPVQAVISRCQHLFCIGCFRNCVFPGWPNIPHDIGRCCSACQTALYPTDAVEVNPDSSTAELTGKKKTTGRKEKRQKGMSLENFHPSTKVKALLGDLVVFSRANPYSANYDPASVEVQMVDEKGNEVDDGIVKTVVFSQWTTMLDKVEDALEAAGIRYDRLDGTMKRDERTRAMDNLKYDPGCEVLLVSLKAGGVGLNLTAAQRVYLMDPYWNPAVENQAVDRIHRLGQTRPVTTVKLIIENTIEARLLEVQKKKTELANMTLGQHLSKAELSHRRMEELNQLFHP